MSPPTTPNKRSVPYSTESPKKKTTTMFIPPEIRSPLRHSPKKPPSSPQKPVSLPQRPQSSMAPSSQHVVSEVAMQKLRKGLDESERADTEAAPRWGQPCSLNPAKSADYWLFSRSGLQAYLDTKEGGWKRDERYKGIVGDIEVYKQSQVQGYKPTLHAGARYLVIISSEGVLSANQFISPEQRGANESFIATPSLWAYTLAQMLGQGHFFLFFRHGAYLQHVKYYGQCRIRDVNEHLSKEQWDALDRTERDVVAALSHKLWDHVEIRGDIRSPLDLRRREPWVHARIYAIERGPLIAAFFEHARNGACRAAVPPKDTITEANGPRRIRHLPSPEEMKME
ncbi:hypothetical protein PsYK624_041060 [Phanerochaete sordida]|uniref:Uncharacterized protein n=1 Tax=Phanerochaete sordida TaxID=48140 RepID=A0A9P3G2U7_9APHY|nr:hypothetical protein PsYK624_041060 [Phanerochaete sordida]